MNSLRTVVVDDEQLAREELCFLLSQLNGIDLVAQAGDGVEALRIIEDQAPDLVMLDVQMPGLTGFEVARRLLETGLDSQLVFVTAFDRHAIEAFDVNAVDYLLKPVESARLETAIERSKAFADALQSQINGLTTDFAARDDPAQRNAVAANRQKALTELDRVKKEITENTKALADLSEEARRAGVPPGWLR